MENNSAKRVSCYHDEERSANMTREGQPGLVAVPRSVRQVPIGTFGNILRQAGITRRLFETAAEEVL